MSKLLHNKCTDEFKKQLYKGVLTLDHLQGGQKKIDTFHLPDGDKDEDANFWGYAFKQDKKRYLLDAVQDQEEINLKAELPIEPLKSRKVAYKENVYWHILTYNSVSLRSEKRMSFKELVDKLAAFKHDHHEHYKLMWLIALTQWMMRMNVRVASPRGFGKNSVYTILNDLVGKIRTISSPSRARLEKETAADILTIDEVVNITPSAWKELESFLLSAGDFKQSVEKQTLAHGTVGETLDISSFSLGFIFNDIDHYPSPDKYIDHNTNKALLDRFLPVRLFGEFSEDFTRVARLDVSEYVNEHYDEYMDLVYSLTYYKENILSELENYDIKADLSGFSNRHKTNLHNLFKVFDLYADDQEEFEVLCEQLLNAVADYRSMLRYPDWQEQARKELDVRQREKLNKQLGMFPVFSDKISAIKRAIDEPEEAQRGAGQSSLGGGEFWSKQE